MKPQTSSGEKKKDKRKTSVWRLGATNNQRFWETLEAVVGPVTLTGSQSENLMANSVKRGECDVCRTDVEPFLRAKMFPVLP